LKTSITLYFPGGGLAGAPYDKYAGVEKYGVEDNGSIWFSFQDKKGKSKTIKFFGTWEIEVEE